MNDNPGAPIEKKGGVGKSILRCRRRRRVEVKKGKNSRLRNRTLALQVAQKTGKHPTQEEKKNKSKAKQNKNSSKEGKEKRWPLSQVSGARQERRVIHLLMGRCSEKATYQFKKDSRCSDTEDEEL